MKWYELLYRKICIKFFGAKYCDYTTRHKHDLIFMYRGGKNYWQFIVYECSVCKQRFIRDGAGLSKI